MKYRKKPVDVEVFQMTKERRWDNSEWPSWMHEAWQKDDEEGSLVCLQEKDRTEGKCDLYIITLEGIHNITWDDYIIQGVKGEIYPCKTDIFEMTYERVE